MSRATDFVGDDSFAREDRESRRFSHRFFADLFRANANRVFHWQHENFAVADFSGLGSAYDGGDRFLYHVGPEHDFHFHFRQKIDGVFAATIDFGMTFLATEAFHFGHGHTFNTKLGEGFLDLLELERLDDRFQFFHSDVPAQLFTS